MDFDALSTEQVNQRSKHLDELSPLEAVELMNELDAATVAAVAGAKNELAQAVEAVSERLARGGRLVYCGAGTSGRLGVLDASECPPTFGTDPAMVVGVIAGGDRALRFAVEGAEDSPELGAADMSALALGESDALVAISASGYAPYCVGALDEARRRGAYAIALSCNAEPVTGGHADLSICLLTGPEILSGSTRLKAGTATKMALNMLTTLSMVRLGKAYQNLMVDMQPSNQKLRDRAVRIVRNALPEGTSRETAEALLTQADGDVKAAIVHGLTNQPVEACKAALQQNGGFVRKAAAALQG